MPSGDITYRTREGRLMPVQFVPDRQSGLWHVYVDERRLGTLDREPTRADYVEFYNTSAEAQEPGKQVHLQKQ